MKKNLVIVTEFGEFEHLSIIADKLAQNSLSSEEYRESRLVLEEVQKNRKTVLRPMSCKKRREPIKTIK